MCVRPIHTCLFIGMLMPAIRAISLYLKRREKRASLLKMDNKSPLALLVAGVRRANDVHHAPAAHDLAVLADLLDRRTDFHDLATRRSPVPEQIGLLEEAGI